MQRSIEANKLFVLDSVARHAAPLGVQQVRILLYDGRTRALARRFSRGSMPERGRVDKDGLSTAIGPARGDFVRFGV
jgi:hypothetical protein